MTDLHKSAETETGLSDSRPDSGLLSCRRRHLRFGWWSLLVFLTLGLVLEGLHGLKVGLYLDVSNQTRRLMWTLAHAHGTLLALVHVAFGVSLHLMPAWDVRAREIASPCLIGASVLLPAGFFLGGVFIYSGDPGLGILLVPLGGLLLLVAVLLTALGVQSLQTGEERQADSVGKRAVRKRRSGGGKGRET